MTFEAKLNGKFHFAFIMLTAFVFIGWYGVYVLNTNTILMEDGTPMSTEIRLIFSILISLIAATWTFSLVVLGRQLISGAAFRIDEEGIHTTATAMVVLAFLVVVPIKDIPYDAIQKIEEKDGMLILSLDRKQIKTYPALRFLVRKQYHFFAGFTKVRVEELKQELRWYGNRREI